MQGDLVSNAASKELSTSLVEAAERESLRLTSPSLALQAALNASSIRELALAHQQNAALLASSLARTVEASGLASIQARLPTVVMPKIGESAAGLASMERFRTPSLDLVTIAAGAAHYQSVMAQFAQSPSVMTAQAEMARALAPIAARYVEPLREFAYHAKALSDGMLPA